MRNKTEKDQMDIDLYIETSSRPWLKRRIRDNPWYMLTVILTAFGCIILAVGLNLEVDILIGWWPIGIAVGVFALLWSILTSLFNNAAKRSRDYTQEKLRVVDRRLNELNGELEGKELTELVRQRLSAQKLIAELTKDDLVEELSEKKSESRREGVSKPPPEPLEDDKIHEYHDKGDAPLIFGRTGPEKAEMER